MIKKIGQTILTLVIVLSMFYAIDKNGIVDRLSNEFFPCKRPITYSIGEFDPRFKISKETLLQSLNEAEKVWELPIRKNLFEYSTTGKLKINLVYDNRQEATEALKNIGYEIDTTRASYDKLSNTYSVLDSQYKSNISTYDTQTQLFNSQKQAYESEVEIWNSKGGAPSEIYEKLQRTQATLEQKANQLNELQAKINEQVDTLNTLAGEINRIAADLNLNVSKYNTIGAQNGEEFQEGVYTKDQSGEYIDIYQFDNQNQLIRVLAHEFGHALGIEHVADSKAIMYKLNTSKSLLPTQADIQQLKLTCKIE